MSSSAASIDPIFEYLITNQRWFFVVFFLIPMSVCYDLYLNLRNTWSFYFRHSNPKKHSERVKKISDSIKNWMKDGCKEKMCTARPGWQAMSLRAGKYKKTYRNIELPLYDVLEVNETTRTCTVEPMCSMGQLSACLLPLGWTLPVVPELDDLTVGGLVAGVGIETSSHKYGLFQHICVGFEVVLPDGSVVKCNEKENTELFRCIPWSHGTLGFVVAVEIKIIRSLPFVHLTYLPFNNRKEAFKKFEEESRAAKYDFVECLAYSSNDYVLMLGNMTADKHKATFNPIGLWYQPWFFKHVETILNNKLPVMETIPLRDYYHRHTKSLFWEMQDIVPFGNNIVFRWLFGWTMPPKPSLLKLTQTEALRRLYELHHVVQDMLVPINHLYDCIDVFDQEIHVYPLWICPFKLPVCSDPTVNLLDMGLVHPSRYQDEMFVDVGAYGNPTVPGFQARDTCRKLEEYVRKVKGYQMMYADSYMTKEEFRSMFDHHLYDKLRDTIPHCKEAFPEIYDKVSKAARR